MFAEHDKHYPSRSWHTSLATAVKNFTKPVTKIYFWPSRVQSTFWAGQATRDCSWACHNVWKDIVGQAAELQASICTGTIPTPRSPSERIND